MDLVKAFTSRAQFDRFTEDDVPSTLSDTIAAAFALAHREERLVSAENAWREKNNHRAKQIAALGGNERLVQDYGNMLPEHRAMFREAERAGTLDKNPFWRGMGARRRLAYEHVRDFERRFPDQVPDDQKIIDDFKAEAAKLRSGEQFTLERGSAFGAFIGTAGAVMTDPPLLISLGLGAEISVGRSVLATVARFAAIEGAIGVGIEIPIQAQVLRFKRAIESPWSFKQSAMNVLAAGVGGAVFGGVIAGGVVGVRQTLKAYRDLVAETDVSKNPFFSDAEVRDALRVLEDTVGLHDENPLRVIGADGEAVPVDAPHERAFEEARVQHADGEPVDVRETVEFLEPDDGISRVLRRSEDTGELVDIDPTTVSIDAKTFQFKTGVDGAGVDDTLKGVTTFDRRLAGVSLIWERADGKRFVADGHQRQALALRALEAGQDPAEVRLNGFLLREADGVSALDARRMAAVKNMAEGSGSALDAAKLLRDVGPMGEAILPPLPPRSALIRQARGLAGLGEDEFLQVINGVIDERFGALVGGATADPKLQQAMIDVLRRTKPANETQARSIVDQVRTAGTETRITEDLFGEQQITESLYLERAQVLDAALREASKDKTVFGRLLSEEGRIIETGQNRLDRAANQERLQEASNATTQISRLANTVGPISDALSEAARQVKAGRKPGDVVAPFLQTTRRAILEGDRGGRQAGGARPSGDAARTQGSLELQKGRPLRLSELPPNERAQAELQVLDRQADLSVADIYAKAEKNQKALAREAKKIVAELGEDIELADPGIKVRKTSEEKLARKGKSAGQLTDIVRLGFLVRTPDIAVRIIERLAEKFEVLDKGITVTGMGYLDHKALVRFSDGRVGEVQLWDPELARAKFGPGEDLYASVRSISDEDMASDPALLARRQAAEEASKDLYANALAKASDEWRRAAMMILPEDMRVRVQAAVESGGSIGAPGKASRNAFRESSEPDSRISTVEARDQEVSPAATKKPSEPPTEVSRITAGRASQLKNRSAIDAPPRKIVREVDDTRSPMPDATRTGTIPDTEYDAVMSQAHELIAERGALAQVGREVNGELEMRSLASELESLDVLEETLERIRICSFPGRNVA